MRGAAARTRFPAAVRLSQAEWSALLDDAARLARLLGDEGAEGPPPDVGIDLLKFHRVVRDASAESFPSPSPIARLVAAAFLNAARAFASLDASAETRTACAPLFAEAQRLTDSLLNDLRTSQFQRTQFGGDA